jgi:peptidoglycan hydrolase-like protein with peptidoglycan-binding domain
MYRYVIAALFLVPLFAFAETSAPAGILSFGARGEGVTALQQRLISLGLLEAGNDTGYFGPLTRAAVREFQQTHGIVSSGDESSTGFGQVGPRTSAALSAVSLSTSRTAASNPNWSLINQLTAQVQALQAMITQLVAAKSQSSSESSTAVQPPPAIVSLSDFISPSRSSASSVQTSTATSSTPAPASVPTQPTSDTGSPTIYVSLNGNDQNPGTLDAPVQTIERAQALVRTKRSAGVATVYVRGGVYYLSQPLAFGATDSNTTYLSYPGEHAVFSGGTPITNFAQSTSDPKLFYAYLGAAGQRQLFSSAPVTDQPTTVRYPSNSEFKVTSYAFAPGSCDGTGNPGKSVNLKSITLQVPSLLAPGDVDALGGSELVILKTFTQSRIRVGRVAITGPNELTVYPEGSSAKYEGCNWDTEQLPGYRAHFEGDWHFFEEPSVFNRLPGSYAFANNSVYFYARSTDAAPSGGVVVPQMEKILDIDGAHDLTFDGIDFEDTAWNEPSISGYVGGQSGVSSFCPSFASGGCAMPSIIRIANASNIAIKNATIAHGGGVGISIESGHDISLEHSTITDVAGSGIVAGTFGFAASAPSRVAIRNNTLRAIGRIYDGTAILAPYTTDSDISNNTISDVSYSGISLGWFGMGSYPPSNTTVSANDISNVLNVHSDGGGIYIMQGAAGTHVSGNYIHDIRVSDGAFTTNIRPALYLDNAASNVTVSDTQVSNTKEGVFLQTQHDASGDYRAKNNNVTVYGSSVDTILVTSAGAYDPSNTVVLNQGLRSDIVSGAGVH